MASMDLLPNEVDYADSPVSRRHFHDLTSWSRGLLTNAAAGGFKRDFNLLTERWDQLAEHDLPFYTYRPGVETRVSKYGIEIALDIALNCSPDHPYLKEHPDWFYKRPDGGPLLNPLRIRFKQ